MPLIGFAGAPFTVASYLVEGGPTRTWAAHQAAHVRRRGALARPARPPRRPRRRVAAVAGRRGRPGGAAVRLVGRAAAARPTTAATCCPTRPRCSAAWPTWACPASTSASTPASCSGDGRGRRRRGRRRLARRRSPTPAARLGAARGPGQPRPGRRACAPWDVVPAKAAEVLAATPAGRATSSTSATACCPRPIRPSSTGWSALVHGWRAVTSRTAVVLMAYGTPRHARRTIEAYYTDIRRGRPPTPEQLADLVARYDAIGGLSPLAERTEAQRAGAAGGARRAGARRVRGRARHEARRAHDRGRGRRPGRPGLRPGRRPGAGPALLGLQRRRVPRAGRRGGRAGRRRRRRHRALAPAARLRRLRGRRRPRPAWPALPAGTKVLFTAHTLPERILASGDPYPDELRATAEAVATAAGLGRPWGGWASAGSRPGGHPSRGSGPTCSR